MENEAPLFEREAMAGREMPDGLTQEEQGLFLALRALGHQKRAKAMPKEEEKRTRQRLLHEYRKASAGAETGRSLIAHNIRIQNQVWRLIAEFRKTPSIELASRIIRVFDGCPEIDGIQRGEGNASFGDLLRAGDNQMQAELISTAWGIPQERARAWLGKEVLT